MQVETVTTTDGTLLRAVRASLRDAQEAFLCVAFVHERGLQLLRPELEGLRRQDAQIRLLVTTTFKSTTASALSLATHLGAEVRVLNPGGGSTYHPKLYLGNAGVASRAVIGSANLTGGLYANIEAGIALEGTRGDAPISRAWEWAQTLWEDPRATDWNGDDVAPVEDAFDADLYRVLLTAVRDDPVFITLAKGQPNRIVQVSRYEVRIETRRSVSRTGGAEPVPAWMFNLAWERLRTHGTLSNVELLNDLRVHRSAAVCAILARLPQVKVIPGRRIVLKWVG